MRNKFLKKKLEIFEETSRTFEEFLWNFGDLMKVVTTKEQLENDERIGAIFMERYSVTDRGYAVPFCSVIFCIS